MGVVYFGTNRRPDNLKNPKSFGGEFSNDGLANLRFGQATVSGNKVKTIDVYNENFDGDKIVLGSENLFGKLQSEMRDRDIDALLFIHGFNVSFEEALTSASKMANKYRIGTSNKKPDIVVFSWPSDGNMAHYKKDRHDAEASGLAVARGFAKVTNFLRGVDNKNACDRKIHLIAHSMGCYVLRNAIQEMAAETRKLPGVVDQVILTAADEDDDALERDDKLGRLHELCNRATIYFNSNDRALSTSDITKGNPDRLGSNGPRNPRSIHRKYVPVSCERHADRTLSVNHSYHVEANKVAKDISMVLDGKTAKRRYDAHTNSFEIP